MDAYTIIYFFWRPQAKRMVMSKNEVQTYLKRCWFGFLAGAFLMATVVKDPKGDVVIALFDGLVTVFMFGCSIALWQLTALWKSKAK